ncbi:MAG: hypothetical protein TREMPRED_004149, partial [Tremellales sp. Tagirdzhanova-0007]
MPADPAIPRLQGRTKNKLVGKALLYSVSVYLSIGVWLFGYDQGVMSGIITGPYFKAYFNQPTSGKVGNMVAILEIGAFGWWSRNLYHRCFSWTNLIAVTSILAAPLADNYGRRMTLRAGAFVFTVGGAIQTLCTGYDVMLIGRIMSGFGVGMLSMIVPIYQSEISPAEHRGQLGAAEFTGNIIGYACSVWIDYGCTYIQSDWSWRIPLSIQCVGGAALAAGSFVIPESPRYLVDTDQEIEGINVIADFQGRARDHEKVLAEYKEIRDAVLADRTSSIRAASKLFSLSLFPSAYLIVRMELTSSRTMPLSFGLSFDALKNVLSDRPDFFCPNRFLSAGWIGRDAILMTGINSLFYTASSIPPWFLMDRAGRRPILLVGALAMSIALTATGWWIYIDQAITPNAVVICVVIYNAAFGMSWGPVP